MRERLKLWIRRNWVFVVLPLELSAVFALVSLLETNSYYPVAPSPETIPLPPAAAPHPVAPSPEANRLSPQSKSPNLTSCSINSSDPINNSGSISSLNCSGSINSGSPITPRPDGSTENKSSVAVAGAASNPTELAKLEKEEQQQVEREKAQQAMLQNAQKRLAKGDFFHTVPAKLTADTPVCIEAGIAQAVTKALLTQLHMKGQPSVVKDVPYNPLGVEIKLNVDKDYFKVREIKTGIKTISDGLPESWLWELTPIKRGKTTIALSVVMHLNVPGLSQPLEQEVTPFQEEREIQGNLGYSLNKFLTTNWQAISSCLVGSGSVALFLKWLIERKSSQTLPDDKPPAGFGRLLGKQPESTK